MRSGPTAARATSRRVVVLADVDAVGAARLDQVRPVVEDEERVVADEGAARAATNPSSSRRLVAQLDQVHAAAHGGRDPVPRQRGADEVQAGGGEALAWRHPSGDTMNAQNTGARRSG